MLVAPAADQGRVVSRGLVLVSLVSCTVIAASFALFARDQLASASQRQQTEVAASAPANPAPSSNPAPSTTVAPSASKPPQPRAILDHAANALTSPFHSIVQSTSPWMQRGVPTLLALLVYGLGLRWLARFSRGSSI
jgi:hypothetical protein